jgi:hypothetical protein
VAGLSAAVDTCATAPEQWRQAYLGRRVTSTRSCAGTTSSRSETSSPIFVISPQPQGQKPASRVVATIHLLNADAIGTA